MCDQFSTTDLLLNSTVSDIKRGFFYNEDSELYTCLLCGASFEQGVIYPQDNRFIDAQKAIKDHISKQHGSVFEYLLNLDKKYTGLTDNQKNLLEGFYTGLKDKEIAEKTDLKSTSSIRNQRFMLREREKQSKIFLCIMELLNEGNQNTKDPETELIPIHSGATMVDDRYLTTEKEKSDILKTYFDGNKLKSFPSKEKKKIVILQQIIKLFEIDRDYKEKEVNEKIKAIYPDFATIRRYFIEYGFMERTNDCSRYWLKK